MIESFLDVCERVMDRVKRGGARENRPPSASFLGMPLSKGVGKSLVTFWLGLDDLLDDEMRQRLLPLIDLIAIAPMDAETEFRRYVLVERWLMDVYHPRMTRLIGPSAESIHQGKAPEVGLVESWADFLRVKDLVTAVADEAWFSSSGLCGSAITARPVVKRTVDRDEPRTAISPVAAELHESAMRLFESMIISRG